MSCRRLAALVAGLPAALLFCPHAARAAGHQDWAAVAHISAGERVAVYRERQQFPDACDFVSADADTLTCAPVAADTSAAPAGRMVFPRTAIREIWTFGPQRGWDAARWIKTGFITALGGVAIACVAINPICALPVLAVSVALLEPSPVPPVFQPPRQHGPRIRRRLIYRAAASAWAPPKP